MSLIEIRHFHLFCGLGGGAKGFNAGQARVGSMEAKFRCLGGIDVDPSSIADFGKLAGVQGTVLDLFAREQYTIFHGHQPPADWREATPQDIQAAAGHERPHIVFTSAPCKGFSGLLSETLSKTAKYQALNRLTLRGIWLTLEAWRDDPPEFILFENVPRIASRGRPLLDQITALLRQYGYAVAETTHDCGELGHLAQSRKRFLLVARHMEKVPPCLYEPHKRPLRAVGDVLGKLPLPGIENGGPMHRIPALQWKTWVRLAFVQAGSDWRSLNRLAVENGHLTEYLIIPERRTDYLGVTPWHSSMGTVTGGAMPTKGRFAVADPRFEGHEYGQYGVRDWEAPMGTVSAQSKPGGGAYAIADPRTKFKDSAHQNLYRVHSWEGKAGTVTGASHVAGAAMCVQDPRCSNWHEGASRRKLYIVPWENATGAVIGGQSPVSGGLAVADPRLWTEGERPNFNGGGHYGVLPWDGQAGAVSAAAQHDNGRWSVADPRTEALPTPDQKLIAQIISEDATWHRPFTTLELAALQGLLEPEEWLQLEGLSDEKWRERIGNAVPPPAAQAIAGAMAETLLLAWAGETFTLSSLPLWVQPMAIAASIKTSTENKHARTNKT